MTKALFQKYLDGTCTEAEGREVEEWLCTCDAAEADALLQEHWHDGHDRMPRQQVQALWASLQTNIASAPSKGKLIKGWYWKVAAVAASIVVLTGVGWLFTQKAPPVQPQQAAVHQPAQVTISTATAPEWVEVENKEAAPKKLLLQDGSEVLLYSNARLKYLKNFEPGKRDLQLEGKGLFKVAKDKQRPFTVYSRDIATTALGTVFLVNTDAYGQYIRVKLLEGKVMVRSVRPSRTDSVVLHPGQEATYNIIRQLLAVQAPARNHRSNFIQDSGDTLSFTHVPLSEVFDKLKLLHHVQIMYNKKEVAAMNFTGTIVRSDSLRVVLMAIARMNDLTIGENDGTFTVLTAKN